LIATLPPALLIAAFLRYLPTPRKLFPVMVVGATVLIAYLFGAPPRTSRLFARYLGMPVPEDLRGLQRWDENWGIDPAFFLRFYTSVETIERIVRSGRLSEVEPPRPIPHPVPLGSIPAWWTPEEVDSPRFWEGFIDGQGVFVELRFDPESGLAYLSFFTL
jgi:hypothetical protein